MNIPIARTNLLDSEIKSVLKPLESGWLVQGPKVQEFEGKWCAFTGAQNSIAVTCVQVAYIFLFAASGFGQGDEAIVPAFTWISTANVVEHLGGKVVFCDIDMKTFNIDITQIESKLPNGRKRFFQYTFLDSPDMDPILELAKKHNLFVVEDAACGFGASIKEGM